MKLVLASHNAHKTREFVEILGPDFEIIDLLSLHAPDIEETGSTFDENAILKATAVSAPRDTFVFGDDSGLEVDALGGAPGIYSKRYSGEGATDAQNNRKLLDELANCCHEQRAARFRCVIALARDGKVVGTFEGEVRGVIVDLARGSAGFGYDPLFLPNGFDETFGELPDAIRNRISHRAKAVKQLAEFLNAGSSKEINAPTALSRRRWRRSDGAGRRCS